MTTALIAEDEPALAESLSAQLHRLWPELRICGIAADGNEALEKLEALRPEIAFLDIRMPERSGIDVAMACSFPCRFVFVTAYDQYAIQAFEAEAIDYLMKPVSDSRLSLTIYRLKRQELPAAAGNLSSLSERLSAGRRPDPMEWIQVQRGDEILFVPVDDIILFQSLDKLTACYTGGTTHLIRMSLKELEDSLDPSRYWRVHRNAIVRVASIDRVKRDAGSGLQVILHGLNVMVPVSQPNVRRFHGM